MDGKDGENTMYNDYEESFYYDKPSSTGDEVSGQAVAAGLGLGAGVVGTIITVLLFIISRIDLLSSIILGTLFYMLTYKLEWPKPVYIVAVIAIIVVSMLLQHFVKVFRFIYGAFTCVVASILGPILIGHDSDAKMYGIMAICFVVTAVWGFLSWRSRS